MKKYTLIPLIALAGLLGSCDSGQNRTQPTPTVISNEEAIKELDGKTPSTTEVPVTPTDIAKVPSDTATDKAGAPTEILPESTHPAVQESVPVP